MPWLPLQELPSGDKETRTKVESSAFEIQVLHRHKAVQAICENGESLLKWLTTEQLGQEAATMVMEAYRKRMSSPCQLI